MASPASRRPLAAVLALSLITIVTISRAAPGTSSGQMTIASASHDASSGELTIDGDHFGLNEPSVTLGGLVLDVVLATDTRLVADATGFEPGSYRLVVSDGRAAPRIARFDASTP